LGEQAPQEPLSWLIWLLLVLQTFSAILLLVKFWRQMVFKSSLINQQF